MTFPLEPSITLHLHTTDGIAVDPVPAHDHVTVNLGGQVRLFTSDPTVMEACARAFWDAADHLHAKAGTTEVDADVARTLEIATGGAA